MAKLLSFAVLGLVPGAVLLAALVLLWRSIFAWQWDWVRTHAAKIAAVVLLISSTGCATLGSQGPKAIEFTSCVFNDERLSIVLKDPVRARAYLEQLAQDVQDMVEEIAAEKRGPTKAELERIADVVDLNNRIVACTGA